MQDWTQIHMIGSEVAVAGKSKGPVTIGNAVWIGDSATILPGVTVGDGAVIGAGSVVTKTIPPFAIAVGNPARVVRMRFSEAMIELLLQIEWWHWDPDTLRSRREFFEMDLSESTPAEALAVLTRLGYIHDEARI